MRDLGTMKVLHKDSIKVEYVVIKIGGQTFSTSFNEIKTGKDIDVSKSQVVTTNGIGVQVNHWIKGKFKERERHEKLKEELPFEINIYYGA